MTHPLIDVRLFYAEEVLIDSGQPPHIHVRMRNDMNDWQLLFFAIYELYDEK